MEYAEHDGPRAGATSGAFRPSGPPGADGVRYADSGSLPDRARPAAERRFPRAEWYPDADTGIYPVLDGYAGYQGYAGEPPAPGADRRPARPPEVDHDPARPAPAGYPPVLRELAGSPVAGPPPGRLARLRPDRWILAGGGLAATVAVIVAFATAGGSTTANTAKTAQTATAQTATAQTATAQTATAHAALPGCVSPGAGR